MRCLLTIQLFKFTGDEIGEMRKKQPNDRYLDDWLPEYAIKDDGDIIHAPGWLQFTDEGEKEYCGFNIMYAEDPLGHEISNMGMDFIAREFKLNFGFLRDICRYGYKDTFHTLVGYEHVVFDVTYSGGGQFEDYDMDIDIAGYLNEQKEFVRLK